MRIQPFPVNSTIPYSRLPDAASMSKLAYAQFHTCAIIRDEYYDTCAHFQFSSSVLVSSTSVVGGSVDEVEDTRTEVEDTRTDDEN